MKNFIMRRQEKVRKLIRSNTLSRMTFVLIGKDNTLPIHMTQHTRIQENQEQFAKARTNLLATQTQGDIPLEDKGYQHGSQ